ncbi:MAG TPA: hypothetical protein VMI94_23680 [Bryobacteraceae bacterium]|nr:hypothetical protein [Bryobacteraceae bacterium]
MRKCFVILLLCGGVLHAQEFKSRTKRLFQASVAAVSAAAVADAATSWGKAETNPLLGQSRFGMAQTGIKIGLVSAALAGQYFIVHRHSQRAAAAFTAVNFASAGVLGAVAYHNSTIAKMH